MASCFPLTAAGWADDADCQTRRGRAVRGPPAAHHPRRRSGRPSRCRSALRGAVGGWLPVAEVTFRTDAAGESITAMAQNPDMVVGAGTIIHPDQVSEGQASPSGSESSHPTTLMSPGTLTLASRSAESSPSAAWSLNAITALAVVVSIWGSACRPALKSGCGVPTMAAAGGWPSPLRAFGSRGPAADARMPPLCPLRQTARGEDQRIDLCRYSPDETAFELGGSRASPRPGFRCRARQERTRVRPEESCRRGSSHPAG